MSPRAARRISRGIVVASIAMIAIDVVLLTALENRPSQPKILVVGDPSAPGMAEVRAEIEGRLARGEILAEERLEPVLFGALALLWAVTGSLIVSRQPRNLAGWILCLTGASVPLNGLAFAYTLYGVRFVRGLPARDAVAIVGEYSFASILLVPLLARLFR